MLKKENVFLLFRPGRKMPGGLKEEAAAIPAGWQAFSLTCE